jgi:translation initiation factor 1
VYSTEGGDARRAREEREEPAPAPGSKAGIRLRLERRASGRMATVVTGLPGTASEAAELARVLKTAAATGGTFKDDVLELQGDQRARVETALAARGLRSKRAGG